MRTSIDNIAVGLAIIAAILIVAICAADLIRAAPSKHSVSQLYDNLTVNWDEFRNGEETTIHLERKK